MKSPRPACRLVALLGIGVGVLAMPALADCPEQVGHWPYGPAFAVAVSGEYAYFGSGTVLMVADISNPTTPRVVGDVALPDIPQAIAVSAGYAYLVGNGLRVIDVSTPSAPVEVGFLEIPYGSSDVAISGGYAYLVGNGLRVIDVSTPSAPIEVGSYEILDSAYARGTSVSGGYVFVAGGDAGMYVFRECGSFTDGFESGDTSAWSATVPWEQSESTRRLQPARVWRGATAPLSGSDRWEERS